METIGPRWNLLSKREAKTKLATYPQPLTPTEYQSTDPMVVGDSPETSGFRV